MIVVIASELLSEMTKSVQKDWQMETKNNDLWWLKEMKKDSHGHGSQTKQTN